MKKLIPTLLTVAMLVALMPATHAQKIDTIRLKDQRLLTSALQPGLKQYLVYFQMPKSPKDLKYWLWLRDVRRETKNGENIFSITQHWYGSDSTTYREVRSLNRAKDFAPIYHADMANGKLKAFDWSATGIKGADTAAQNTQKAFKLDFNAPCFNWNLDIETFEMLPLAAGKTFAINFYDAGFDVPKYVNYSVIGSEMLATLDGQKVDCWLLRTESENRGAKYVQTFWISKKGHEFLKEEDTFPNGYRYKVKLPALAPDVYSRFVKKP